MVNQQKRRENEMITRQVAARKLIDFLQHRLTVEELVHWAEAAMMDEDFEDDQGELLRDIVSRIGLADVRAFGLTWEDTEDFLARLGYKVNVTVAEMPTAQRG